MIELTATCACGASITARATHIADVQRMIERWLERHAACRGARA